MPQKFYKGSFGMGERIKKIIDLPVILGICLMIKFVVYYYLTGWSILSVVYLVISMAFTMGLYMCLARSKSKHKVLIFSIVYLALSIFMFADVMYFNYYNQTVSIAQLWQVKNVAKVPKSFVATFIPLSIFLLLDIPFVLYSFKQKTIECTSRINRKRRNHIVRTAVSIIAVLVVIINPAKSESIAKVTCDEFFMNHVCDVFNNTVGVLAKHLLPEDEVLDMINKNTTVVKGNNLNGIAKGKNLIVVQLEAYQDFLINAEYNGFELSPNLNDLINSDTLYFDNYYSNIGKGNTVDAEFSSMNSLYPVIEREIYTLYQTNHFDGLPWKLKDNGYNTFAVHGYEGAFWNREEAYPYQGIDNFYSEEVLDQSDIIGLGISDKSMFRQAINIMKNKQQPFFSLIVSLTNHHPFELDESQCMVPIKEEDAGSKLASYLQTAYYTDEAIGEFIGLLKKEGLYDNSVIVFYGDHHGLNKDMDDNDIYMSRFLGKQYDYDEMLNVPLIIHIPGSGVTRTISTVGGQIDFYPTIANLMGLKLDNKYILGQDIVNADKGFVAFTAYMMQGSFITDNVMYEMPRENIFESGRAWNPKTGEELNVDDYKEYYERAIALKEASSQILKQDMIPR